MNFHSSVALTKYRFFSQFLKKVQSGYDVSVGLQVLQPLCQPGTILIVMPPWHEIHDFIEPDEDGIAIQHSINLVVDKEHQLTLLLYRSAVGIDSCGMVPVLQQAH